METSSKPRSLTLYSLAFCCAFVGVLLLPLLGFRGDFSAFEQEYWGAARLRKAYATLRQGVFGDTYFGKAIRSRDGWLVHSAPSSLDDFQRVNLFSEEDLERIRANLDATNAALAEQGVTFLVVLAPNKNTIYPEYLPAQIPVLGAESRLGQLAAYLEQYGKAPVLDLRQALLEAKKQHPVFFATDTHWNPYGALAATQAMITVLQSSYPQLRPYRLSDYEKSGVTRYLGDLAGNYLPSAAAEEGFGLEPKYPRGWVRFNLSDQMPVIVAYVNASTDLPRALVYHDSFMIWQYDFLADYFSKATFIWSYNVDVNFAKGEKPDIVILECTERYLDALTLDKPAWNED
jgi:hypothetical protein